MIVKIFCFLPVVFIEWEVAHLLVTVCHGISKGPDENVLNDSLLSGKILSWHELTLDSGCWRMAR